MLLVIYNNKIYWTFIINLIEEFQKKILSPLTTIANLKKKYYYYYNITFIYNHKIFILYISFILHATNSISIRKMILLLKQNDRKKYKDKKDNFCMYCIM